MGEVDISDCRESPEAFLDGLVSNPMNMGDFKTEDGEAFVYSAIDCALDKLKPRDAEGYVSRLSNEGYDTRWKAPAIIDPI